MSGSRVVQPRPTSEEFVVALNALAWLSENSGSEADRGLIHFVWYMLNQESQP